MLISNNLNNVLKSNLFSRAKILVTFHIVEHFMKPCFHFLPVELEHADVSRRLLLISPKKLQISITPRKKERRQNAIPYPDEKAVNEKRIDNYRQ